MINSNLQQQQKKLLRVLYFLQKKNKKKRSGTGPGSVIPEADPRIRNTGKYQRKIH